VVGGGLQGRLGGLGSEAPAFDVADVVDHEIQPVRRQAADGFGQVLHHQVGDDLALEG